MRLPLLALLHAAAVGLGTYIAFAPTLESRFAVLQTDPGDTVLNHYLLEHTWRAVADPTYRHSLWSPPFFYPAKSVLAYSENMLGVAPLYWLLRCGLPTDLAYQAWMMLLCGLNYAAMAAVLTRLPVRGGDRLPPLLVALGGFLWAFGLPPQTLIGHQQLLGRFWMPPAFYFAWRFTAAPNVRWLNGVAATVVLQTVVCINTGWFLVFALAAFVPLGVWLHGTWPAVRAFGRGRRWLGPAVVCGAWAAALLGFLVPYFRENTSRGRDYGECVLFMPTLGSPVTGPAGSAWDDLFAPVRGEVSPEAFFFSGLGFYAMIGIAAVAVRTRTPEPGRTLAAAGLLAAATLFLLTLNYGWGVSPWWLVRWLPGGFAIRAVGRVHMALYLLLIPSAMVGFALWVQARWRNPVARQLVYAVAAAVVGFEQVVPRPTHFEKEAVYGRADRVAERVAGADAFYLVPAEGRSPLYTDLWAMWAGLRADVPTVNGYSGRHPDGYPEDDAIPDDAVKAWLGPDFRGTLVIVDPNETPWAVRRHVLK